VDDLPAVWKATNYVLTQAQREEMTLEQFRAGVLPAIHKVLRPLRAAHSPAPTRGLVSRLVSRSTGFRGAAALCARISRLLPRARTAHLLLSTIHEKHFAVQAAATGFGTYLDRTYLGVHDKRKLIHGILEENNLRPEETVFIGDMQHDIETARHGKIQSWCRIDRLQWIATTSRQRTGFDRGTSGRTARNSRNQSIALETRGERFEPHACGHSGRFDL